MKTISYHLRLAAGIAALLLPALTAPAAFFTTDTTIGIGNTNYEGQDIVVYHCTLTVDGSHSFSDVLLVNSGVLTHSGASNGLLPDPINSGAFVNTGLNLVISNNLVVETGSAITTDGKGFGGGFGQGAGKSLLSSFPYGAPFFYTSGGGGGYGGFGGSSFGGASGGGAYGQVMTPTNCGGGGGLGADVGGAGGGSIILKVGGDVLLDGQITANGVNGINGGSGGGAGGGIWLTAASIEGEGIVSANGGMGEEFTGGGGGGGRVAIYAMTNEFMGTMIAQGGAGAVAGGAGTVYTISTNVGNAAFGQVVVDNGGEQGTNTSVDVGVPFDLTISGGAVVPLNTATLGNLVIASNSWLLGTSSPSISLNLMLRSNVLIQPGGGIFADGLGSSSLVGSSGNGSTSTTNGITIGGGGGYGGYGGVGAGTLQKPGGNSSGSVATPNSLGSGGGVGTGQSPYNAGGNGGGAVSIIISGTLQLGGSITANGVTGVGEASGGGSGGSIMLSATTLTGNGVVSANGGAGQLPLGGGGGGGRIAIYLVTNQFTGSVSTYGGAGFMIGGAGTVYTSIRSQLAGQVVVDNARQKGTNTTLSAVPSLFNLIITNGGIVQPVGQIPTMGNLYIAASSFLTVTSQTTLQFTVQTNLTIEAGGGIVVDGEGIPAGSTQLGSGTTATTNGIVSGSGGGNGGTGGNSASGAAGGTTSSASVTEPFNYGFPGGSGGGLSPYYFGGAGGGFVFLTVNGTLQLGGVISANGNPGLGQGSGGGSGGNIRIQTARFTGSGLMSANGGAGESVLGGGGGGGRIALNITSSNSFTGTLSAHGGPGFMAGGAGTIYTATNFSQIGSIVVDNGGLPGSSTSLTGFSVADLTITNGANLAIKNTTSYSLRNLTVASNSFITIPTGSFNLTITGNATIQTGGAINLDGGGSSGLTQGQGQGFSYTTNNVLMGGGGANGGTGGSSASGVPGGTFIGSLIQPTLTGGAGGAGTGFSTNNLGGAGGGALHLTVTGALAISGKISANGNPGTGQCSGGGAGGSIWLSAGVISGNGIISANGGAGEPSLGGGGGGGGGRIALYPTTNLFTGLTTAHGGAGGGAGGAGTIYVQPGFSKTAQLVVDNGGFSGATTPVGGSTVSPSGTFDLLVTNGAIAAAAGNFSSIHNLLVASNSVITLYITQSYISQMVFTVTGDATILPSGIITVDGEVGSAFGPTGQGAGGSMLVSNVVTGGGGGFGGYGGSSGHGVAGGNAYGTFSGTSLGGSAGGAGANNSGQTINNRGGAGGGSIQLTVTGNLQVGGTISANGTAGVGQASGGGSGGGISLTVGILSGNGTIAANGGAGEPSLGGGGGGGGGRILLSSSTNLFTGGLFAHGGAGAVNGGAGTIYTSLRNGSVPLILMDNGGLRGTNTPLTSLAFGTSDVTITNGATVVLNTGSTCRNLLIASNSFVVVSGSSPSFFTFSVTGNATIQPTGGITADGSGYTGTSTGPGFGNTFSTNNSFTGAGGGYGGNGGASAAGGPGGGSYGQITEGNQPGSNGGRGNGNPPFSYGGAGGGSVQFNITGALLVNGIISANGVTGPGEGSGGGAGGGIALMISGIFSGTGIISANGGNAESVLGGGGGGGRISITCRSNLFTGSLTAAGGQGFANGGAGTIYTRANTDQFGQLVLDGGGAPGLATFTALPLSSIQTADFTLKGGARVNVGPNRLILHNLTLNSNTVLSLAGTNGSSAPGISVLATALIQPGAQITADGGGFNGNVGTGAGNYASSQQGYMAATGGSYGGYGGASLISGAPGAAYGSIPHPNNMGSGGGCLSQPSSQSAGGGSVQMTALTLDLEGAISANGLSGASEGSGGGSGGSIQLTVTTLTGAGSIAANGGAGFLPYSGGGGGGRIAIYYTSNRFSGTIAAHGGQGYAVGGAGTIYTRAQTNSMANVLVDNGGLHGTNTLLSAPEAFNLTVSGNAIAQTPPTNAALADPTLFLGSLTVQSNGSITTPTANDNASLVIYGNALIATNGSISADGRGYNASLAGPGTGRMLLNLGSGSGGGYGGAGGASASGEPGGTTYGSSQQPTDLGSEGGVPSASFANFSQGGGAIRMDVAGTLTVNGSLSANGKAAIFQSTGGGAGGSIWLNATQLSGSGSITANGGAGEPVVGGGGGGGRIALYYTSNNFNGVLTAAGAAGAFPGQNGTLFTTNLSAPQIISQSPVGAVTNPVSSIVLTVNSELGLNALTASNFALFTPNASLSPPDISISVNNLYPQDVSQITVSFPQQTAVGPYTLRAINLGTDLFGLMFPLAYSGSFSITQPIIFGNIADTNGVPIAGASVQPGGGLAAASTDINGNYIVSVPSGFSGTLTPSITNYVLIPSSVSYTNLTASVSQNFVAEPPTVFTLNAATQTTGGVSLAWFGASNVTYQVLSSTNLTDWQPYGNPIQGSNGTINVMAPTTGGPQMFFRFGAVY